MKKLILASALGLATLASAPASAFGLMVDLPQLTFPTQPQDGTSRACGTALSQAHCSES
ncbi:hypothetical protein [Poseidonocella sedimentorum]|uniref:Uncharacterized protein n=1 Tax=Poseidonocella sedimentorum TaxID=871652 RepID=A0A1I6D387_9RHOB|nr:hypothetical protein [Poseidonocella sedimentorum]SFQ99811.1 hypothetical protein SAMN04515673_10233 [Poseidonocella sedimentorum]